MRIPLSWLGEFVELPKNATPHSVMSELVKVGLEEEGAIGGGVTGPVVVGQVLEFTPEKQANGKTIRWCQVRVAPEGQKALDGGADVRGIVCGASNFEVGDKVVVTLPGAELPGGFNIAARKTYGHVSDGMIASSRELGLSDEHEGILRLATLELDPEVGLDALELLGLAESAAEVNVTPDRGYCLSIRGIAREYSHATGSKLTDPATKVTVKSGSGFKLAIEDQAPIHGKSGCSRFLALELSNVDAKAPTPSWMVNRLRLAGMRSISIAVDVTNYVMLELGQPLHAYDADKLVGGISVRRAKANESIETLDGKDRTLHVEDLLIVDEAGPIGIAGVMGGARTEVSDSTNRVLLEAATFDPISIARSARRHKLPSEASKRFERGVDPHVADVAISRAADLLIELAGAKLTGVGAEAGKVAIPKAIELPLEFASDYVGVEYSAKTIEEVLGKIGCAVEVSGGVAKVVPPTWRPDLGHKTDLVEEIARLVGYDKIPARIPVAPPGKGLTRRQQLRRRAITSLVGAGFTEVLNYPFVSVQENEQFASGESVQLENPIQTEAPALRKTLLPGLIAAAARNMARGQVNIALVEEGSVFLPASGKPVKKLPVGNKRPDEKTLQALNETIPTQPRLISGLVAGDWIAGQLGQSAIEAGYPHVIEAARLVAKAAGLELQLQQKQVSSYHPGRAAEILLGQNVIGSVGELHPEISEANHLPRRVGVFEINLEKLFELAPDVVTASELRVMPAATQDLSLVVDTGIPAGEVLATLKSGAGELLESVLLVDDYRGSNLPEGKKSLTFNLVFRAPERTLTQAEATAAKEAAIALANKTHGAEIRS